MTSHGLSYFLHDLFSSMEVRSILLIAWHFSAHSNNIGLARARFLGRVTRDHLTHGEHDGLHSTELRTKSQPKIEQWQLKRRLSTISYNVTLTLKISESYFCRSIRLTSINYLFNKRNINRKNKLSTAFWCNVKWLWLKAIRHDIDGYSFFGFRSTDVGVVLAQ